MVEHSVADGPRVVLRIADAGVRLTADGARVSLQVEAGTPMSLDLPNPEAAALVAGLSQARGLDEAELAMSRDAARIHLALERVSAQSELVWELHDGSRDDDNRALARAVAVAPGFELGVETGDRTLDGAAHLRRAEADDPAFPVIFSSPGLSCEIRLSPAGAVRAAGLLAGGEDPALASFLARCGVQGRGPRDGLWSFNDRVMHDATRPRNDGRSIAVIPREDVAHRPPEMEWLRGDPPSAGISDPNDPLARRRTLRDFAPIPPTAADIRALLRRCLAYQAVRGLGEARWVERAFPAAGGVGEIIGYVAVRNVEGLAPGLYRHDPLTDRLEPAAGDAAALARAFEGAAEAMLRPGRPPPAMLILASRIDQLAWKYGKMGYRFALLNAGAAASVVQLAAGDLGLGCCPLGTSAARSLEGLTGVDDPTVFTGGHQEVPLLEIAVGGRVSGRPA